MPAFESQFQPQPLDLINRASDFFPAIHFRHAARKFIDADEPCTIVRNKLNGVGKTHVIINCFHRLPKAIRHPLPDHRLLLMSQLLERGLRGFAEGFVARIHDC